MPYTYVNGVYTYVDPAINYELNVDRQSEFLNPLDHFLLRRHGPYPLMFTPAQATRLFYTREQWARVAWLMNDSQVHVGPLRNTSTVDAIYEMDGVKTMFRLNHTTEMMVSSVGVNKIHLDHELGRHFKVWADTHIKIMNDNLQAYQLIEQVTCGASTWLQVKKLWPELTNLIKPIIEGDPGWVKGYSGVRIPYEALKDVDASRARNLPLEIVARVNAMSDRVMRTLAMSLMLPNLEPYQLTRDRPAGWLPYMTRPIYQMRGFKIDANSR